MYWDKLYHWDLVDLAHSSSLSEALSRKRSFPASSLVLFSSPEEKNWNLIEGQRDRLFLEYFIEPHIVSGPRGLPLQKQTEVAGELFGCIMGCTLLNILNG